MHDHPIDDTQRMYARLAGSMYLFNYVTAVFGAVAPSRIMGSGDFAERVQRILASEHLYRAALVSMAISWVLIVILAFALYVTLEPVNKRLAQIALFMELGQACVGAVTVMLSFGALRLYTTGQATGPFQNDQLQVLVSVTNSASGSGFQIAMTFLAVGSTLFFYLFYKSRYIPRPLAAWGVFASVLMLMVSLAGLTFPEYASTLQYGWGPMGIAEIATAFWLMIVGIRLPPVLAGEVATA
jgi:hypothetical protein